MKSIHSRLWYCVILLGFSLVTLGNGISQEDDLESMTGIIPVDLSRLFTVMPEKEDGWKLTKSKGWRGQYRWLEAIVTRESEQVPDEASKELDEKPAKVRLTIKDTCKYTQSDLRLFSEFTEKKDDVREYVYMNSIPTIVTESDKRTTAQFLLYDRFVLSVTLFNLPKTELGEWFRKVEVESLASVKDGRIMAVPENFVEQTIDQLKKRK